MNDETNPVSSSHSFSDDASVRDIVQALSKIWWLPLLRGIFLVLLGIYALIQPGMTVAALAQVMGFFLILDGSIALVAGVIGQVPSRGWTILRGVVAILVGIFVFANPVIVAGLTAITIMYLIAFSAIFTGIMEIIATLRDHKEIEGDAGFIFGGILSIAFGVLLLMAPFMFGMVMVRILGVCAAAVGVAMIMLAFRLKGIEKRMESKVVDAQSHTKTKDEANA
ncbi:acid-resistance membrane protein [Planctomycetes bacterium CA13]|uniref:Acid-resistance membrane protein n=1 Tax=Novipirellula herctigrandis TaxID=2527986 RepID=A0A5C5YNC9_9BACT|nr:acid-resistance membrane protein [Planctomycetes bacterium CA13]